MRVIILAAGHGHQLDGFNKILIRDPESDRNVMDQMLDHFSGYNVTVVVGYRAINIMSRYPKLNYVYNNNWSHTNNSYSLGLAIDDEPCIVVSSDIFFDKQLVEKLFDGPEDCILTENNSNRTLTSLNCEIEQGKIVELYQGAIRSPEDPEAIGVYKISNLKTLRAWKQRCLQYSNLFIGQNLPVEMGEGLTSIPADGYRFDEINTPADYIRLLERYNDQNKGL